MLGEAQKFVWPAKEMSKIVIKALPPISHVKTLLMALLIISDTRVPVRREKGANVHECSPEVSARGISATLATFFFLSCLWPNLVNILMIIA